MTTQFLIVFETVGYGRWGRATATEPRFVGVRFLCCVSVKGQSPAKQAALEPAFIARRTPSNESNWCAHQLWGPLKAGWFLGLD